MSGEVRDREIPPTSTLLAHWEAGPVVGGLKENVHG